MQAGEQRLPKEPERTPQQDMQVINSLDGDQVWLYVLAQGVPVGSRIMPPDAILRRIGVSSEEAESLERVFGFCARQIALLKRSPASTLAWLVGKGLKIDYANLIVDVATANAQYLREAMMIDLSDPHRLERVERIEERLGKIEKALKPRKAKTG